MLCFSCVKLNVMLGSFRKFSQFNGQKVKEQRGDSVGLPLVWYSGTQELGCKFLFLFIFVFSGFNLSD